MKQPVRGTNALSINALSIVSAFWRNVFQSGARTAFFHSCDPAVDPVESPVEYTWLDLGGLSVELAERLTSLGLREGDRLASWIPNSLDWIILDVACQTTGVCHAAIDFREPEVVARRLADQVGARFLLTSDGAARGISLQATGLPSGRVTAIDLAPPGTAADHRNDSAELARRVSSIIREPADTAPAQILFTSGSTGMSKPVHLSSRNLYSNAMAKLDAAPQRESDLRLNILPFTHAYARTCELSTWILSGSSLAISSRWSDFVVQACRSRPTLVNCVPYLAKRIADTLEADELALGGRLRLLQVGGAALPIALFNRLSSLGLPPICGYGLTETSPVACSNRNERQLPGTVGYPVADTDIRVAPSGELFVRGPGVMLGYGAGLQDPIDADGWLATGDFAEIHPNGHVVLLGRMSHQIVLSTGYKVDPTLIESRIQLSGLVSHCLVTGDGENSLAAFIAFHSSSGPVSTFETRALGLLGQLKSLLDDLPRHAAPQFLKPFPFSIRDRPELLTAKGTLRRNATIGAIRECSPD